MGGWQCKNKDRSNSSNSNNTMLDVPWDHYTFDLAGDADLQPALRKKVEILETAEGFCMFYPKQRPGKQRNDRSNKIEEFDLNVETESEERDPNASFSSLPCATPRSDSESGRSNRGSNRSGRSIFASKQTRKKGRNNQRGGFS